MKQKFNIITLFALITFNVFAETKQFSFVFSQKELNIETKLIDDTISYCVLELQNSEKESNIGYPDIPVKYISQVLPANASDIKVSFEYSSLSPISIPYKIIPIQEPETTSLIEICNTHIRGIADVYDADVYPMKNVELKEISSIGNKYKNVIIAVYPLQYYPKENLIELADSITITLSYSIDNNAKMGRHTMDSHHDIGLPYYEYCVITSRELCPSFSRLISWKRNKGINAGVVCIEDILNNPYIIGDTISYLYDDAGKLRQYLQYAYNSGNTQYVLMGGNDQVIPIRYGTSGINTTNIDGDPEAGHIPTDFYYCELDANWNVDNDEFLGEKDLNDYGTELYVGRILCTNDLEISNYTDKLLRYELNPGNGDFTYLSKALFTQADQLQYGQEAQKVATDIYNIFPTITILEENPSYNAYAPAHPTGNEVVAEMNNRYSYYSWFNHGNPTSVSVKTSQIHNDPVYGLTTITGNIPWIIPEIANGLDKLTNKDYPAIVYSVACSITPFDVFDERIASFPNMGQSFTLGKDYGGPALIGNTRIGYVDISYRLQKKFNSYIDQYTIGNALALAKQEQNYFKHHHALVVNIIGCPELKIWTSNPIIPSIIWHGTLQQESFSLDRMYDIGIHSILDGELPHKDNNQIANYENNTIYTIHGSNVLPKILPLYIQNATINQSGTYLVSDVYCGKNITTGTEGNVIFNSGIDFAVEKSGVFSIDKGVKIERGAKFTVRNSNINYN